MKKNALKKTMVMALATVTLGVSVAPVVMLGSQTALAATVENAVADETSERSVTIWKYQIKDTSELGERGDGTKATTDKTPLEGIKFKVQRVKAIDGASLTDPLKQVLGTDYEVDTTFTEQTLTTGADGSAVLDLGTGKTNDGIYLFTELEDDRVLGEDQAKVQRPADPFFVYVPQTSRTDRSSLIYDVQVQPKNILDSLLNPDKTVEGGKGYSLKAGQKFTWEAISNVPDGISQVAGKDLVITPIYDKDGNEIAGGKLEVATGDKFFADFYTITDTIDARLDVNDVKLYGVKADGTREELTFGTDYTVTVNGTAATAPVTASAGTANEVVISIVKPTGTESSPVGMEKIATNKYAKLEATYNTVADKDFNGTIDNHFDVAYQVPGGKPVIVPSDNDPEYFAGGFDIEKTGEDTKAALEGAVFHLSLSKADADAGIFLGEDGKSYGVSGGTVADAETAAQAAGTTLLTSTSDANGKASFNGLKLDWFTDTDGDGKQGTTEPTWDKADIKKSYWVTETTAPKGYELLKESKEVVVNLDTADTVALEVVDKKETVMPFTGGTGMLIIGVVFVGAMGVGFTLIRKGKKEQAA